MTVIEFVKLHPDYENLSIIIVDCNSTWNDVVFSGQYQDIVFHDENLDEWEVEYFEFGRTIDVENINQSQLNNTNISDNTLLIAAADIDDDED